MQEMQPQVAHTATSTEFTSIRPLGDRLVLRQTEALAKTKGGIYIPDAAKEKPTEGVVLSVGEGRMNEAGMIVPVSVKVGDTVLFNKFAGQPVVLKEQEFVIIREGDVLGVLGHDKLEGKPAEDEIEVF